MQPTAPDLRQTEYNASSDRWSKMLVALTTVLVVFTAALICLAWVLLARGG
ncbi:MAG: hypothetical protein ACREIT_02460 [Tepidisphaeraceae bacterium]